MLHHWTWGQVCYPKSILRTIPVLPHSVEEEHQDPESHEGARQRQEKQEKEDQRIRGEGQLQAVRQDPEET